ncbi:MAG: amino acid adenylation domain-containing protein, partial [Flavobacteriaceae bacterium]
MKDYKVLDIIELAKEKKVALFVESGNLKLKKSKDTIISKEFLGLLKTHKEELIRFFESQSELNLAQTGNITRRRASQELIPLSFSQERLWFLDQLQGSENYHIPIVFRVKGDFKLKLAEQSLELILRRHEVLRTVIKEEEGIGYQHVIKSENFKLNFHENIAEKELSNVIEEIVILPFDLTSDYMLRADVIDLEGGECILLLVMHHIAADGWSIPIFFEEFRENYSLLNEGKDLTINTLPVQYSDYSIWQREYLQGDVLSNKVNYWKKQLKGVSPLNLPIDFTRSGVQSFKGSTVSQTLDKKTSEILIELGKEMETSLFTIVLAVYNIFLSKYSGQNDICVGIPVANRSEKETQDLIGFFTNTLAIRSGIDKKKSFKDYLIELKKNTLEAYNYQDVPFDKVVNSLDLDRDPSRSILFQVMFSLQENEKSASVKFGENEFFEQPFDYHISKYDLTLNVTKENGAFLLDFEYCTDLFKRSTIERMVSHFIGLTKSMLDTPDRSIQDYEIMTSSEQENLLKGFNETEFIYDEKQTLIDLFENSVSEFPDNIALVHDNSSITYKDLSEKVNKFAHYLLESGLNKGDVVGLIMDRSVEMIVSILGVIRARGTYLPIDKEFPISRIDYMLEDSEASILIYNTKDLDTISFLGQRVDFDLIDFSRYPVSKPKQDIQLDDICYIIYTSGSTGKPKGVLTSHRNIIRLVDSTNYISIIPEDIILQLSNYAFDGSVFDIFGALLNGAKLILIDRDKLLDINVLSKMIQESKVSVFFVTTALLNAIIDVDLSCLSSCKKILFGGEKVSFNHIEKAFEFLGPNKLVHVYGPTESTVFSTFHPVNILDKNRETIPIGKPITNTSAFIVNSCFQLQPAGIEGELWISGDCLSQGYLNNEELTNEKFIKGKDISWASENIKRFYRTGDLCRWLSDGTIEFVGRIDDQVKIRGYRIELGEIESCLSSLEGVNQSVVLVKEHGDSKHLVAYIDGLTSLDKTLLEESLKTVLPDYMIPRIYVIVDGFKLTSNGKIDKKSLPEPALEDY